MRVPNFLIFLTFHAFSDVVCASGAVLTVPRSSPTNDWFPSTRLTHDGRFQVSVVLRLDNQPIYYGDIGQSAKKK